MQVLYRISERYDVHIETCLKKTRKKEERAIICLDGKTKRSLKNINILYDFAVKAVVLDLSTRVEQ